MNRDVKPYLKGISLIATTLISTPVLASDFNLPFVNAAGLGNMYAATASSAEDASTGSTNPAGLVKIHNKQFVGSAVGLIGNTTFKGTSNTIPSFTPNMTGTAKSQLRGLLPGIYFAAPFRNVVLGLGVNIPFALGTSYPKNSVVRYAATRSQVVVSDIIPSIGVQINEKLSVGAGLDIDRLAFTLNHEFGFPLSIPTDSEQQNHLSGWGYGFHAGVLYDFTPATRVGFNYASQVMVNTTGDSEAFPLSGEVRTTGQRANVSLPALAQLSAQHHITDRLTVMGTIFYTHWSCLQQLTLKKSMLPNGQTTSITIPFGYHNTLDYALGLTFKTNDKFTLKTGVQFLNTPSNNRDRSLPDPVGKATVVAIGGHYQQNKQFGYDIGYAHSFFYQTHINSVTPIYFVSGHSNQSTNLLGVQVTWDIV
jgi:long-chain fatty acid transport protein